MILFLAEHHRFSLTLGKHSQGRGLHSSHIQGTVIQNGEKTGGIDTHQPIRFLSAKRRLIQGVILCARSQVIHTLTDRAVLHRGNPQSFNGFLAAGHFINQTENELTFASCVTSIDDGIHVGAVNQGTEIFKGRLLARGDHIAEGLGENGKVVIAPFLEILVISRRVHRGNKVAHAPGNDIPIPLKRAIGPGFYTQGRRDRFCYTRFFCDNQLHSISSVLSVVSVSVSSSIRYSSSSRSKSSISEGTLVVLPFFFTTRK